MTGRVAVIVLDGLGIGSCPDQAAYGDRGSDTLGNLARAVGGLRLPNLERLGLGCCRPIAGLACGSATAAQGVAIPQSKGKDSTTGHWELCGLTLERPFPTYAEGFPPEMIRAFSEMTGRPVIGNRAASGTAILTELGDQHQRTGAWIVYTSADSVFQVAAHEGTVPLDELYAACAAARERVLVGSHAVSRVIARPFVGTAGNWRRTGNRRDFSVAPPGETLLDRLAAAAIPRVGIGKVDDLFAGRNITATHVPTNPEAYARIADALRTMDSGFLFVNVPEFDQTWGHRNDVPGFHEGLVALDAALPGLLDLLRPDDLVMLTADHGNDPTTPSTDHSREAVPILVAGPRVRPVALGERTFGAIGGTVAEYFGMAGDGFLQEVAPWAMP
jgi:phosphopentomutase